MLLIHLRESDTKVSERRREIQAIYCGILLFISNHENHVILFQAWTISKKHFVCSEEGVKEKRKWKNILACKKG